MKHNRRKAQPSKVRKSRETRAMLASRFRVLCADAGLSVDQVAQTLHVTSRTVRYWFSGKSSVPYAAYKLVRVMRWFELPQKGFEGWCMHSGKLWTPEGHGIAPEDGGWWSLLVRQARCFRTLYQRSADFERALMLLTAEGLRASDARAEAAVPEACASVPRGPAAKPPANLLLNHFRTQKERNGLTAPFAAIKKGVNRLQDVTSGDLQP
jgi:DNA-binding transcriptional regulator YiaG